MTSFELAPEPPTDFTMKQKSRELNNKGLYDVGCQSAVLSRKKMLTSAEQRPFHVYVQTLKDLEGSGESSPRKLHKPVSIGTAIDTLHGEESNLKSDDYWDPWDYDRMWNEISAVKIKPTKSLKTANVRTNLQVSCVKRQPSDQTPLLARKNLVIAKSEIDYDDLSHIPTKKKPIAKTCMTLPAMGSRDKSLLPKNALVRYLGKAVLSTNEIVSLDLTRPVKELYTASKSSNISEQSSSSFSSDLKSKLRIGENLVSYKNGFVLLRINEKSLILEDTSPAAMLNTEKPADVKELGDSKPTKTRKISKQENPGTSRSKLFRRKSSPHIQRGRKNNLDIYKAESKNKYDGYLSDDERLNRGKRNGKCIFSCMNCTRRGDIQSDDATEITEIVSSQGPSHNSVIANFDLPRIAYCGVEEISGSYLLAWVYHVTIYDIHVIECHVTECDDRQHARSLASSLGSNIQKAVRQESENFLSSK